MAFASGLPGIIGHLGQHPDDQCQGQHRHEAERASPTQRTAQPGPQRHAQRQRDGRADHRDRHRPSLLMRLHHASRVTRQQTPGQPRRDTGEEARAQGEPVARRQRGDRIEQQESDDGEQQHSAPPPATGGDGQRDGRQHRPERIGGDRLSRQRGAHGEPFGQLRQQSCRQGFGDDADESGHGQCQQGRMRHVPGGGLLRRHRRARRVSGFQGRWFLVEGKVQLGAAGPSICTDRYIFSGTSPMPSNSRETEGNEGEQRNRPAARRALQTTRRTVPGREARALCFQYTYRTIQNYRPAAEIVNHICID